MNAQSDIVAILDRRALLLRRHYPPFAIRLAIMQRIFHLPESRALRSPALCKASAALRPKIESGVKHMRRNFVCGLLGREPSYLMT